MHEQSPIRKPDSKRASGLESRLAGALPLSPMSLERQTGVAVNRYPPPPPDFGLCRHWRKIGKIAFIPKGRFYAIDAFRHNGKILRQYSRFVPNRKILRRELWRIFPCIQVTGAMVISLHCFTGFLQEGAISCLVLQDHGIWAIINTSLYYRRCNI